MAIGSTLVLLQFNQSIVFLDVVGSATALGAILSLGFPIPSSKVCVFHSKIAAGIGFNS